MLEIEQQKRSEDGLNFGIDEPFFLTSAGQRIQAVFEEGNSKDDTSARSIRAFHFTSSARGNCMGMEEAAW